jgi:hypothetical protein
MDISEPGVHRMRHRQVRSIVVLVILATALAGCASQPVGDDLPPRTTQPVDLVPTEPGEPTDPIDPVEPGGPAADLGAARAQWAAAGLDTYSFEFLDDCGECDQLPVQSAVVWDGAVMDPLRRVTSIDEAFALIESALDRGAEVDVEYHPELGYPTDLWIDQEARAYDGGTHLVFSAVEPDLPGEPASLELHQTAWDRWRAAGLESYEFSSAVICDCEYQVSMRTTVVDGLVTGFDTRTPEPTDITFSPLTIEQLFSDVEALLSGEDFPLEGIRVTGSALYDGEYGYPVWIGLDIEVTDPEAAAEAGFPPRLVMTVSDLNPLVSDPSGEVEQSRARWESFALDGYTFDLVFHDIETADFSDAFMVEVIGGEVVSVVQNGYDFGPDGVEGVGTIDELFDSIASWELAGHSVDVIYDAELGYPAVVIAVAPDGTDNSVSVSVHR